MKTEKNDILNRLKRAEGQLRGIQKMIDEEQECLDEKQLPQDLVYQFTVYHFI